jgi:hypothetical protein
VFTRKLLESGKVNMSCGGSWDTKPTAQSSVEWSVDVIDKQQELHIHGRNPDNANLRHTEIDDP